MGAQEILMHILRNEHSPSVLDRCHPLHSIRGGHGRNPGLGGCCWTAGLSQSYFPKCKAVRRPTTVVCCRPKPAVPQAQGSPAPPVGNLHTHLPLLSPLTICTGWEARAGPTVCPAEATQDGQQGPAVVMLCRSLCVWLLKTLFTYQYLVLPAIKQICFQNMTN